MTISILGSGTSHGVPVVGCTCPVCLSGNVKNKRTRASIAVHYKNTIILIDTATEFRLQAIREGLTKLDAIFFTHSHADHLHGLDDIRSISREKAIPMYGSKADLEEITNRFPYIFYNTVQKGGGKPQVIPHRLTGTGVKVGSIEVKPIPVKHGKLDIYGYRFNKRAAYITDCSEIPEESFPLLQNLDVLIIGALRYRSHPTHFNIEQALQVIKKISPGRAYLTHICHDLDHDQLEDELPGGVFPAYDGLKIDLHPPV
ncbi:MBL fold metallo-hydrolase [Spirochaeta isovalerica]|uniref:Phosphoribosyl 1,2-cyclic phosphate phosphodiesterase n=1 Tax=Spirochaeta isovalerica TaxID=150 RepID=A0A841R0W3_9SPIO|nr:MBL fold metallo-hydrolase [Spirochaeta isovalerica]MBB6478594.1 phosphoribosyl 1,2-cyclic phosphate phosphodiesterase [Spirochaeta isovalerica]